MAKVSPYPCPGCDRHASVFVRRSSRADSPHFLISCSTTGQVDSIDPCLGHLFGRFEWPTETAAVSAWNNAVIDMGAAALGVTRKEALALREHRARVVEGGASSTGRL